MAMECAIRHIQDVTIMDLRGRLSLGEALAFGPGSDLVLTDAIARLAEEGHKKVILNLAGVKYVDSSGVGQLVGAEFDRSSCAGSHHSVICVVIYVRLDLAASIEAHH